MQQLPLINSFIIYIYIAGTPVSSLAWNGSYVPLFYLVVMYIQAKRLLEWGKSLCRPELNLVQQELIGLLLFAIAAISLEWQIAGGQMLLSRPRNRKRRWRKGKERLFWFNIKKTCDLKIIIIVHKYHL